MKLFVTKTYIFDNNYIIAFFSQDEIIKKTNIHLDKNGAIKNSTPHTGFHDRKPSQRGSLLRMPLQSGFVRGRID